MLVNNTKTIHHDHYQLPAFVFHVIFINITAMYTKYFILLTLSVTLAQTKSTNDPEGNLTDALDVTTTTPITTLPTKRTTSSPTTIDLQRECEQDVGIINFQVGL